MNITICSSQAAMTITHPTAGRYKVNGTTVPLPTYMINSRNDFKHHYITKEIMGVKGKPDIIERKRLQWYGHVKRMPEERIPKLILEWVPAEWRKRGRPRKTWVEIVQAAMTARNIEQNQWRNREEWCLVSGRRRKLS
jgi:hypothetical protein